MRDILYVAGTVAFFGLMLAYVSFCERLSGHSAVETVTTETRP